MPPDLYTLLREAILPPTSLFLLGAIGWLLRRRWRRTGTACIVVACALAYVLSSGWGARMIVAPLEARAPALKAGDAQGAGAIVVLAAGRYAMAPDYGGEEVPDYIALARLRYAAHLQRTTGLPLLVSGGNATPDGRYRAKALAMARALREDFGVPVRWVEGESDNTDENARFSARLLRPDGIARILLVTDAMHMPRSVGAFERAGLQVVPAPTVYFAADPQRHWTQLLPSAEQLRRSCYALYEWIGLAWYAVKGDAAGPKPAAAP